MFRFLALICLLSASVALASDPAAAVVRLEMHGQDGESTGSAVLIGNGMALTAEHCRMGDAAFITQPIAAEVMFDPVKNGVDEAQLIRVDASIDAAVSIGPAPHVGDSVYGIGYPHGRFQRYQGRVTDISAEFITTDLKVDHGASGGGLFNSDDQLIGICSAKDTANGTSLWIHTDSLQRAVSQAVPMAKPERYERDTRVVVLSMTPCGPCERLKRDIAAGAFPGFTFDVATYDLRLRTWDKPELYEQFKAECKVSHELIAPTIWVPETGKYREGYDTRPGLLGWFEDVVKFIFHGPPPRLPAAQFSTPPKVAPEATASLLTEFATLKDQVFKFKADYDQFKEAGVLGKIKAIALLKEDKAQLQATGSRVKEKVLWIKEHPLQALFSLMGSVVTGSLQLVVGKRGS